MFLRAATLSGLAVALPLNLAGQDLRDSFELRVADAPSPVTIDGRPVMAWELHITNFHSSSLELTRIEVLDAELDHVIADFRDVDLDRLLGRPGQRAAESHLRVIPSGMRAIAYFWLPLVADARPSVLTHRLAYRVSDAEAGDAGSVTGGIAVVSRDAAPILGPPLRGGPWLAIYAPDLVRGHRRVSFALDGTPRIPARFAIDWMKADTDGRLHDGDGAVVSDWFGHGEEVLAVADGVVVSVRATMGEQDSVRHVSHGLANASGNYITLDVGEGRFVTYEHLLPNSISVVVGDSVRSGQVIARLGNTGDSSGPHLHLHVSDGASPLAGEGVPFVLDGFELIGRYGSISEIGGGPWAPAGTSVERRREMPPPNSVVRFADGR